ncbi:MAG TPA: hypothetical protein P5137_13270 [Candidatus Brocadiia bacterium]|nr:hypothetical protein [Candidatus Brocadiia bacterium]
MGNGQSLARVDHEALRRNQERIDRFKRFYRDESRGVMALVMAPAKQPSAPAPFPLDQIDWASAASRRAYASACLDACRAAWAAAPRLDDDGIPGLQNLAGTGAIGAAFVKDAVVRSEATTNYLDPPIRDWSRDISRIGFDPDNPWYRGMADMLRVYVEAWDGSFGLAPFTHFDPLDLCNQWRGNDLFTDFHDNPEELRHLLGLAVDALLALEKDLRANYMRGFGFEGCVVGGAWTPGDYLSCDAGDLCSPGALATWGLPYTQRIVEAWGGAFLHHHELGVHQIPTWAECRKLSLQFLNRDPNTAHLAQGLSEDVIRASWRVPVSFISTGAEFLASAEQWARGRFYVIVNCDSLEQARAVARRLPALRNF